jgi:hypothetical protein
MTDYPRTKLTGAMHGTDLKGKKYDIKGKG